MGAVHDARSVAFDVLRRVEEHKAYAGTALGRRLARSTLTPPDQALATRIVYGTLAWQGRLDWHIADLCERSPSDLDACIRVIIRLGLFQILFLDRVPAYAAVNTSVNLARRFRRGAATGLVNATLRRAAAGRHHLRLPDIDADRMNAYAVRWSHPRWLVDRWRRELGETELESLLRANQQPAPTVLRVNTLRTRRKTLLATLRGTAVPGARATEYSPDGIRVDAPLQILEKVVPAGCATVQSEASQVVAYMMSPRADEHILDTCAAPGGKATHLAALMENRGHVMAVDVAKEGLASVRQRARALGISIVHTHHADARLLRHVSAHGEQRLFDRVLVDAPCSGLGTLRSHPEIRWRLRADSDVSLTRLQLDILRSCAALCSPDGVLVYATCTINGSENDRVIEQFCSEHPEFEPDDPNPDLPPSIRALVGSDGFLRSFPHRHGMDGFFAARLRRRGVGRKTRHDARA